MRLGATGCDWVRLTERFRPFPGQWPGGKAQRRHRFWRMPRLEVVSVRFLWPDMPGCTRMCPDSPHSKRAEPMPRPHPLRLPFCIHHSSFQRLDLLGFTWIDLDLSDHTRQTGALPRISAFLLTMKNSNCGTICPNMQVFCLIQLLISLFYIFLPWFQSVFAFTVSWFPRLQGVIKTLRNNLKQEI